ncbi:hypothetical protein [Paenibacillus chitinolyticus]|uniref:Uncharacterized protein n=1 Tax=Paenibacillus chitinolyticus TaxID=79263 RepID=A0ABT4F8C1_9BACL|nr:hypothetical protein [Paenibacillus chitinolyticus]MCY9592635.1 hypothetical protein [Paenibacillus chitinolyticus]MCY9594762.1 hypothetical protein [Paenibacillus chitinolyticus]
MNEHRHADLSPWHCAQLPNALCGAVCWRLPAPELRAMRRKTAGTCNGTGVMCRSTQPACFKAEKGDRPPAEEFLYIQLSWEAETLWNLAWIDFTAA